MGVGVWFDMTRSNIPFGSLDICVPTKSLTEQRQKPYACLLTEQTISISSVGEGLAPPDDVELVTAAHPSIAQKRDLQKPSPVGEGAEERGG